MGGESRDAPKAEASRPYKCDSTYGMRRFKMDQRSLSELSAM